MPWSDSQVRLFGAAAHNPEIAKRKGIAPHKAREMLMEAPPEQRSKAMSGKHMAEALGRRMGRSGHGHR